VDALASTRVLEALWQRHCRARPGNPSLFKNLPKKDGPPELGFTRGQAECAEFIAERKVDVERLFTHRWRLEQAEEAYRLFDTQTTGKAVILPS
jgi:hypothetical protein